MLTEAQLFLAGLIATIIVQIVALVYTRQSGKKPSKLFYGIVALVVSLGLAYAFAAPKIALSTDPMQVATQLLEAATGVIGLATLFYNVLLNKFFELSGVLNPAKLLAPVPAPDPTTGIGGDN